MYSLQILARARPTSCDRLVPVRLEIRHPGPQGALRSARGATRRRDTRSRRAPSRARRRRRRAARRRGRRTGRRSSGVPASIRPAPRWRGSATCLPARAGRAASRSTRPFGACRRARTCRWRRWRRNARRRDVPVVLHSDLDPTLETGRGDPLPCQSRLLVAQGDAHDGRAVLGGGVHSHGAPAATDVEQSATAGHSRGPACLQISSCLDCWACSRVMSGSANRAQEYVMLGPSTSR